MTPTEINLALAERVMGYAADQRGIGKALYTGRCIVRSQPEGRTEIDRWAPFEPYTNLVDAFEVVRRMYLRGIRLFLQQWRDGTWVAVLVPGVSPENESPTAAICTAALNALDVLDAAKDKT